MWKWTCGTDWPASLPSWIATLRADAPYSFSIASDTFLTESHRSIDSCSERSCVQDMKHHHECVGACKSTTYARMLKPHPRAYLRSGHVTLWNHQHMPRDDGFQVDKRSGEFRLVKDVLAWNSNFWPERHLGKFLSSCRRDGHGKTTSARVCSTLVKCIGGQKTHGQVGARRCY